MNANTASHFAFAPAWDSFEKRTAKAVAGMEVLGGWRYRSTARFTEITVVELESVRSGSRIIGAPCPGMYEAQFMPQVVELDGEMFGFHSCSGGMATYHTAERIVKVG